MIYQANEAGRRLRGLQSTGHSSFAYRSAWDSRDRETRPRASQSTLGDTSRKLAAGVLPRLKRKIIDQSNSAG